jgi:hypothetical protein
MGLITAWVGYALLKREVQKGYTQVTADVEELFERYLDQDPEPNTLFQIVDGQIVDAVTGEIVGLPQTTEVTEEMEETARARHDLTTD